MNEYKIAIPDGEVSMGIHDNDIQMLVEKGIRLLEEAEEFELDENYASAIFKYQNAAEILSKCKLPREKLDEIYDRIAHLNRLNAQKKEMLENQSSVDPEALQDQAFQFIDQAKMWENQNQFPQAAEAYMNAVQLLMQAGWDESQLTGFQLELQRIRNKAQASMGQQQMGSEPNQNNSQSQISHQPQSVMSSYSPSNQNSQPISTYNAPQQPTDRQQYQPMPQPAPQSSSQPVSQPASQPMNQQQSAQSGQNKPQKTNIQPQSVMGMKESNFQHTDQFTHQTPAYQSSKLSFEDLQNKAFACIDHARQYENSQSFNDAVAKYREAVSYLTQAGWGKNQLERFQDKIDELCNATNTPQANMGSQSSSVIGGSSSITPRSGQSTDGTHSITPVPTAKSDTGPTLDDLEQKRKKSFRLMQAQKQEMEEKQEEAFGLLDKAKKLEHRKQWDESIEIYNQAASILNEIGWTNETANIYNTIEQLKREKEKSLAVKKNNLERSQKFTQKPASTSSASAESVDSIFKLTEFEKRKKKQEEEQQKAFTLLDEGEKLATRHQYDEAIEKYEKATIVFSSLGWTDYTPKINQTIQNLLVEKQKRANEMKRTLKPQKQISVEESSPVKREPEAYVLRTKRVSEFEEKRAKEKDTERRAFEHLSKGEQALKKMVYDVAIDNYQKAIELLRDIGWNQQVEQLNEVLKSIIDEKGRAERAAQQEEVKRLERERKDKKVAQRLSESIKNSRSSDADKEKLEKLKEYQDKKSKTTQLENEALDLIDQATNVSKGLSPDYDTALKLYNSAKNLLIEAGWTAQLDIVDFMVESLQKEKLRKEQERALKAKRQKTAMEEHSKLKRNLQEQQAETMKIKQQQYEKLKKYQENKKASQEIQEYAFYLMDEAKKYIQNHQYDNANKAYHAAIEEFSKIQWNDQIAYVNHEIKRVQKLKADYEADKKFMEDMKTKQQLKQQELQKAVEDKKKKQMTDLKSISDMIKNVSTKKSEIPDASNADDETTKSSSGQIGDLKKEIRMNIPAKKSDTQKTDELKEKKHKEKREELKLFRDMIRKAAQKKNEESK